MQARHPYLRPTGRSFPAFWLIVVLVLGLTQAGLAQQPDQPAGAPAETAAPDAKDAPDHKAGQAGTPADKPGRAKAAPAREPAAEPAKEAAPAADAAPERSAAPAPEKKDAGPAHAAKEQPKEPAKEPAKDAAREDGREAAAKEQAPAKDAPQPDKAAKGAHAPAKDDVRKESNKDAAPPQQAQTVPAPGEQPAPAEPEDEDQIWKLIQQRYAEEVGALAASAQALTDGLDARLKAARQLAADVDRRFERIKIQQGVADGSPWEMRSVVRAAQRLERDAQKSFAPHLDQTAELNRVEQKLAELETEFKDQLKDNAYPELSAALNGLLQDVQKTRTRLKGLGRRLTTGLAPVRDALDRVTKQRARLEENLPTVWRSFFFEPSNSFLNPVAWKLFVEEGARWSQGLTQQTLSFTKADRGELRAVFVKTAIYAPLLAGAAFWLLRLLARRRPDLADWRQARTASLLLALGAACLLAVTAAQSDRLAPLAALGQILAGLGLAQAAWLARSRLLPPVWREQASPLPPLWGLFSLGLLLQVLAVPGPALAPGWCAALLLAFWRLTRRAGRPMAGLEKFQSVLSRTLVLGLAALTALGFAHLSILVAAVWFLICLAATIGLTVSTLLGAWHVSQGEDGAGQFIEGLVHGLGFPAIVLGLAALIVGWLAAHLGGEVFLDQAAALQIGWGAFSLNLFKLVMAFTLFFVTRSAVFVSGSVFRQLPGRWPGFDRGAADSLQTVSAYALWAAFALAAMFLLGVDLASLAVIAGGLSVGIGFGMQNIVNNFVSGLILLFGRAVQAGDVIKVGDVQGVVQKVQIRNAVVQTFDNATVFVPNSDLLTNNLVNWSHKDPRVRREIMVGVAYGSDTALVTRLLVEAARQHESVLAQPEPDVLFKDFGASTLDFVLRFWVVHVDMALSTTSEVRYAVERTFREHGVEIAYPQQELHIRTAPALEHFLRFTAGDDKLAPACEDRAGLADGAAAGAKK